MRGKRSVFTNTYRIHAIHIYKEKRRAASGTLLFGCLFFSHGFLHVCMVFVHCLSLPPPPSAGQLRVISSHEMSPSLPTWRRGKLQRSIPSPKAQYLPHNRSIESWTSVYFRTQLSFMVGVFPVYSLTHVLTHSNGQNRHEVVGI